MGRRVERAAHRVARFGNDPIAQGDDRAHWNFAGLSRLGCKVEGAAHWRRKREAQTQVALFVAAAASFCGGTTSSLGTFTVRSVVPTFTEPVWTSKLGVWPPFATTPLLVAEMSGALAPRIWLMSTKRVALPAMIARMSPTGIRRIGRIACSLLC